MLLPSGTLLNLWAIFTKSSDNSPVDPTVATCTVSDGTSMTKLQYEIVRDSIGHYHCDYLPPHSGTYTFEWTGSGACICAQKGSFQVSS